MLPLLALLFALVASYGVATAQRDHQIASTPAVDAPIDMAAPAAALELEGALSPYHAPGGNESDGSRWYILTVSNSAKGPVSRILVAPEPAGAALRIFPQPDRARLLQVASSDGGITVHPEDGFSRDAFRVTVPPATTAALAIRVANADSPPSVLAWREPELMAYQRQLAIFLAAVAGLIATAAAVSGGVAAMTGHSAPGWAALMLAGLFGIWLADAGQFDASLLTALGGPYGFAAALEALSLVAAIGLVEAVAPLSDRWPWSEKYRRWTMLALLALAFLAFVGVPAVAVTVNIVLLIGVTALAAYVVRRGGSGSRAARVLAPSAAVFALVTLGAALAALGVFQGNPIAAKIVGGFAAAGAVLVALAGPVTNLLLALGSTYLLYLAVHLPGAVSNWAILNLRNSILINIVLAAFNMIPLLPLDGGRGLAGRHREIVVGPPQAVGVLERDPEVGGEEPHLVTVARDRAVVEDHAAETASASSRGSRRETICETPSPPIVTP